MGVHVVQLQNRRGLVHAVTKRDGNLLNAWARLGRWWTNNPATSEARGIADGTGSLAGAIPGSEPRRNAAQRRHRPRAGCQQQTRVGQRRGIEERSIGAVSRA